MDTFNTLYKGEAADAADALEQGDADPVHTTVTDLRLALINALRRIDQLENAVAAPREYFI